MNAIHYMTTKTMRASVASRQLARAISATPAEISTAVKLLLWRAALTCKCANAPRAGKSTLTGMRQAPVAGLSTSVPRHRHS